jgi:hypothetical protein
VLPENVDMDKISWYDMLSEEVAWMESWKMPKLKEDREVG